MKDVAMSQWVSDIMRRQQAREQALADAVAMSMGTKLAPTSPYLYAKQDWEGERDALISQASQLIECHDELNFKADLGTPDSPESHLKKLGMISRANSPISLRRAKLNLRPNIPTPLFAVTSTQFANIWVSRYRQPCRSTSERQDSLREAAMSSLDGSMKVYPVQLSPIDWVEGLSTSFTMEDLTQDPELVSLQMGTKGDPTDLQNKVAAAQMALDSAQSTLSQAYSSNVIAMANTCLDAVGKVDTTTLAGKIGVAQSVLAELPGDDGRVLTSSRALSQMMAALALAEATDTKQQQQQLALQIHSLTGELKELQTRWQILTSTTGDLSDLVQKIECANENPEEAWLIQQRAWRSHSESQQMIRTIAICTLLWSSGRSFWITLKAVRGDS
ncbi:hypothetical protein B0H14DRAFT_3701309 [Mycena olivaceomarginata]|nr:hypothetical protein B0H14DRAFT_3701309 [Mycena olivaceomarginata]